MVYLGRIIFIRKHVGIKRKEGAGLVDTAIRRMAAAVIPRAVSRQASGFLLCLDYRKDNPAENSISRRLLIWTKERGALPRILFSMFTLRDFCGLFVELLEICSSIFCRKLIANVSLLQFHTCNSLDSSRILRRISMIFLLRVRVNFVLILVFVSVITLLVNSIVKIFAPHPIHKKRKPFSTLSTPLHRLLYNSCVPQSFEIILIISFT